jgi:CRISPR/Cas system-associated exonuclease Cas4 (RecB family)
MTNLTSLLMPHLMPDLMPFVSTLMVIVIVGSVWFFARSHTVRKQDLSNPAWRIEALRDAKLISAEKDFEGTYHGTFKRKIKGRPDQVYRLQNGMCVVVELKTRNHFEVYNTDRAQLSLYAYVLRLNGRSTADYGYVVIQHRKTGHKKTLKVELHDDAWAVQTLERYVELQRGSEPTFNITPKCNHCSHQVRCHAHLDRAHFRLTRT